MSLAEKKVSGEKYNRPRGDPDHIYIIKPTIKRFVRKILKIELRYYSCRLEGPAMT